MKIIGLDIGGTKCVAFKADVSGNILQEIRIESTNFEKTYSAILVAIKKLRPGRSPLFGISCGGPLDSRTGTILSPPNLSGWYNVPIVDDLQKHFGGEAFLMNDANACALAEWQFGAGRGTRSMVFLTYGTGMGSGLILDGRLYEGSTGDAGEIGHVRLATDGPVGYGKSGSFEGFCSGRGMSRLAKLRGSDFSNARELAIAASAGDTKALAIMQESAQYLGTALSILIDVLNPEVIVLGSIFARCQELLESEMMKIIQKEALPRSLSACRIVPAELGERIGHFGAISTILYSKNLSAEKDKT